MANITVSTDIDALLKSVDNAAVRAKLGVVSDGLQSIALGVANPMEGLGVAANLHTEGYTDQTPAQYFKKVGPADTDWEQILISTDSKYCQIMF